MLKKRSRTLLALLLTCGLVLPQSTAMAADGNDSMKFSESTMELIEMFPEYKESLENNTTGVLVGEDEVYVKMTPKVESQDYNINGRSMLMNENPAMTSDEIMENFEVEYYSKEEFDANYKQSLDNLSESSTTRRSFSGIGSLEVNNSSWLRLDLQVHYGSGASTYMAYNFCSWLTRPVFRFTDGIGISTTSGLIVSSDASTRSAMYKYPSPFVPTGVSSKLSVTNQGNGVLAQVSLMPASLYNTYPNLKEYNNMMISTGVSYSGSGVSEGWITGHYLHKQIAVGGIGMSSSGVPSLSIAGSYDTHSGTIHVGR